MNSKIFHVNAQHFHKAFTFFMQDMQDVPHISTDKTTGDNLEQSWGELARRWIVTVVQIYQTENAVAD